MQIDVGDMILEHLVQETIMAMSANAERDFSPPAVLHDLGLRRSSRDSDFSNNNESDD